MQDTPYTGGHRQEKQGTKELNIKPYRNINTHQKLPKKSYTHFIFEDSHTQHTHKGMEYKYNKKSFTVK